MTTEVFQLASDEQKCIQKRVILSFSIRPDLRECLSRDEFSSTLQFGRGGLGMHVVTSTSHVVIEAGWIEAECFRFSTGRRSTWKESQPRSRLQSLIPA